MQNLDTDKAIYEWLDTTFSVRLTDGHLGFNSTIVMHRSNTWVAVKLPQAMLVSRIHVRLGTKSSLSSGATIVEVNTRDQVSAWQPKSCILVQPVSGRRAA